jgi:hypothetical protein
LLNAVSLNPTANFPVVSCIAAAASIISTALLGLAFVETMKYCKRLEYEGNPQPSKEELKKHFQEKYRYFFNLITQWFGENSFGVA